MGSLGEYRKQNSQKLEEDAKVFGQFFESKELGKEVAEASIKNQFEKEVSTEKEIEDKIGTSLAIYNPHPIINLESALIRYVESGDEELALRIEYARNLQKKPCVVPGVITKEEEKILRTPLDPENEVWIKFDGAVYVPWIHCQARLNNAFGAGGWDVWRDKKIRRNEKGEALQNQVLYIIRSGKECGIAEAEINCPFNEKSSLSEGDVFKALESRGKRILSKSIGVCTEVYDPKFCKWWRDTFAESYQEGNYKKWRVKDSKPASLEKITLIRKFVESHTLTSYEKENILKRLEKISDSEAKDLIGFWLPEIEERKKIETTEEKLKAVKSIDELNALWKSLSSTIQDSFKNKFSVRKRELTPIEKI